MMIAPSGAIVTPWGRLSSLVSASSVSVAPFFSAASDAREFFGFRVVAADDVVLRIGDDDAAVAVEARVLRAVESAAYERPDFPRGIDKAKSVAVALKDVKGTVRRGDDCAGIAERGLDGECAVLR